MKPHPHEETSQTCSAIAGAPVAELLAKHGSPLFVFAEGTLRRAYRSANAAFERLYPDVRFAWSYKANYLKAICGIFHQEGAIAEVVSDFEYDKALALGVPGDEIIFNGPYKQPAALERAIDDGAKIQIDNFDELSTLSALAERKRRTVGVAIRLHMDTGARPVWSKFGFNADTSEANEAIKRIHHEGHLRLIGLHTHVGTYISDPAIYTNATRKLLEAAEVANREYQQNIGYLNLGGGFAPRGPGMDAYAEAICRPIHELWPKGRELPRLYLETGRALIDEAGYLITTIVAVKGAANTADYVVDSGINLLNPSPWNRYEVLPARQAAGPLRERTLFGCLCMNIDVLREKVALPDLDVGDPLVLHPVGAYNVTQSMQFIAYRPRIVMVTETGQVEVIRERENLEHVEALERVPDRLKPRPDAARG